jgi:hypothetical protein
VRVASVPTGHPYVRALSDDRVIRLEDPPVPGAPPGRWWPSPWLEPSHLAGRAAELDLLHVHFGFDDRTPGELRELVRTLRAVRRPLVLTVHDLRNPHHAEPGRHDAALDVLVPAADAVITLTAGAAAEIRERWGRDADVLPHPTVVPAGWADRPRPEHDGFTIGLHAKSHRTNADPVGVARALAAAAGPLPGARVRVDAHDDERGRAVAAALRDDARLDVRVHPPFDDDAFHAYLLDLDVSVLPYRWGTHSGWLEVCHDLGTTVLAPDVGHYRDQAPCLTYRPGDAGSVAAAVARAHRERPHWRADPAERSAQRRAVADAHVGVYRRVLGR